MSDTNSEEEFEKAKQEFEDAKVQERKAQTQLDKFARIPPLPSMEDVQATDEDALTKASERKRAATEQRQKQQHTYDELLQRRDELDC